MGVGVCATTRTALDEWILRGQMETVTQVSEVVMDQELASSWLLKIQSSRKGIRGLEKVSHYMLFQGFLFTSSYAL